MVQQLDELSDAEEALMEANILNNMNADVWGYLSLVCLRTSRQVEAEQSYKFAVKVTSLTILSTCWIISLYGGGCML